MPASPYLFAVAFDATIYASTVADPYTTTTMTCTGSNLILTLSGIGNRTAADPWPASPTFNSVAFTKDNSQSWESADTFGSFYHLIGPSTGAGHTLSIDWTGTLINAYVFVVSYSGVNQGALDSFTAATQTAQPSITATTTVVAANCWLVACMANGVNSLVAGGSATVRQVGPGAYGFIDSNATVSTGSQSLTATWTGGNSTVYWAVASIAPPSAAVVVSPIIPSIVIMFN